MPANGHAFLSASSAARWLHCPPSARLGENYKEQNSEYAQEGTEARALCEYKLKKALGIKTKNPTKHLARYSEEMEECANDYVAYLMGELELAKQLCKDPAVFIEQRVDFSRWVKDGFGTADALIVADKVLKVCDYKHGLGHVISAKENPQMMCYALAAVDLFDGIYDIEKVSMTIFQPRRSNVSTFEIAKGELYRWAKEVLQPAAELAFTGEGQFLCGEWCSFCNAKHECRARAEANLLLAKFDFKLPPLLEDAEIEVILSKIDSLITWANDIKEYALRQAVSGKLWKGWKLVEGRSNRKYVNEETVVKTVTEAGFDSYEKKLLSVSAMQKLLGKAKFEELLSTLIEKPQGKPTLVPDSDKRPEMNNAKQDFSEN